MKEFLKNLKSWQKLLILFGFLTIIIIVVVSVILIIKSEPKVEISFDEKVNIPGEELKNARAKLVNVIRNNTENFNKNIVYKGVARDYTENKADDFTTAEFIVDFDSISESYKVSITWPDPNDGSPNIFISCPLLDSKYPETPCATEANDSKDILNYLPHDGKLDSGESYSVVGKYDGGESYVEVKVESCGNEAILNKALEAARKWISSIYLNPDDYRIYVPGDICKNNKMMTSFPYVQANHAKTNNENVNKYLPYFVPDAYNVYPVVNENNDVVSIFAKVPGCGGYQRDLGVEFVNEYLKNHGINYPVDFAECKE